MLSFGQNVALLLITCLLSLTFTLWLNRIWPCEKRPVQNDLIGWQLSILGTTYAVILGFMLYAVWSEFGAATLNAELEASSLRNVYRLASGLPAEQKKELESEAKAYAAAVVRDDWPAMAQGQLPDASHEINEHMWVTLMSVKGSSTSENTAEDHAISELSAMTTYRRTRFVQSTHRLPAILWCVLMVGGLLTLLSVNIFNSVSLRLHVFQVFSFTLLITLVLLAIADVNRPFKGWVHVNSYPFVRAQETMNSLEDLR
jgi:Protein of unknown function (DUF4239)